MAGLLEGVLPAVYSYGNTMQRKLKGLLADPLGTVGLGVTRAGEDQQQLVNLAKDAGYMPGSRSVLATPQQKALAQALLAKQATDMGAGMMQAATVWHGSPHKFDRFDSSKIGTGEGAQAYGHGLYLAENPSVAGEYIRAGKNVGFENWDDVGRLADKAYAQAKGDPQQAMALLDELAAKTTGRTRQLNAALAKQSIERGNIGASLYKVDLPDPLISRMLDWDKPLSQQPAVNKAFLDAWKKAPTSERGYAALEQFGDPKMASKMIRNPGDINGRTAYSMLSYINEGDDITSAFLRQQGIPGIRYLDGGSRGAGAGTSNYVVFPGEESALTILERNGSPVNALVQALRGPR